MVTLTWFGHSAWQIKTSSHTILIDPFISDNPMNSVNVDSLKADYIIVTHGHGDHVGDAVRIAKACNSTVIAVFELAYYLELQGCNTHAMHLGGAFRFPFGRAKLTNALHGSGFADGDRVLYHGNPCGVVLNVDGKNIYHSGDTGLFSDMKLIGELDPLDVALLPIGGNFTMDAYDAAIAASFLKPKLAIPMHYNTWKIIESEPETFKKESLAKGINVKILKPEESIEI